MIHVDRQLMEMNRSMTATKNLYIIIRNKKYLYKIKRLKIKKNKRKQQQIIIAGIIKMQII